MIAGLRRRIGQLEQRIGGESITVHLPDGSVRPIRGDNKHYFRLAGLLDNEAESPLDCELTWIRDAVRIDEPDHVFELLAAILRGPIEDEDGEERNEKSQDIVDAARWQHTHNLRFAGKGDSAG